MTTGTCWICGGQADSSEHVFKARDLRRIFVQDGYGPQDLPIHLSEKGVRKIRGPDSVLVQYPNILCSPCNTSRTSQHDRAYDKLSDWFEGQQSNYRIQGIDLSAVFGRDYKSGMDNLHRYCAKSLGCRVVASGCELSDDFPNPVSGRFMERLSLSICRLERFRSLPNYRSEACEGLLSKGALYVNISRSLQERTGRKKLKNAVWWEGIGHFQISYWFNIETNSDLGEALTSNEPNYPIVHSDFDDWKLKKLMEAWVANRPLMTQA